jgi:proline iminopeptidase
MPLYPPLEPFDHGMLPAGDGHELYWEVCGNPDGIPAVVLHGGPGSGCTPGFRRFFDPAAYRLVLFDQRNCGRSTPHASDPAVSLTTNTTHHLIRDIELLREHLGIRQWLVYGGSWGCSLALAYAERFPNRVTAMVLPAVTTSRPGDVDWLTRGVGRYFPQQWERFRNGVPEGERDGDLPAAYSRLLDGPDLAVREQAAVDWCTWEDEIVKLDANSPPNPRYADPRFRIAFARIVTHYFRHNAWLEPDELIRNVGRLHGIPAVLIHGRLDLGGPLEVAWDLHRAWPGSELVVVDSGHLSSEAGMVEAIVAATDRFARELR